MTWAIETLNLSKQFPKQSRGLAMFLPGKLAAPAVDRVNIKVEKGELFGLLGPNGAGKTTLIKMLSTLILPTSGTAWVNGVEISQEMAVKSAIGVVTSDERSFHWRLTGRQNLNFFAALNGLSVNETKIRISELSEMLDITNIIDERFQTYSTGNRQRLAIARALLNLPQILFLDEPSRGLDPIATENLHKIIQEQLNKEKGITIFLTTHDLSEAQSLCHRIAFMDHGCIQAYGTLDDLRNELNFADHFTIQVKLLSDKTITVIHSQFPAVEINQPSKKPGYTESSDFSQVEVEAKHPDQLNQILSLLIDDKATLISVDKQSPSLAKIFSRLYEDSRQSSISTEAVNQPLIEVSRVKTPKIFHPLGKSTWRIASAFLTRATSSPK